MKKYFSLFLLMAAAILPVTAQTTDETPIHEDSVATIVEEANEAINMADTGSIEVVDTVSEQTNTEPTLTPAGDGLLWQINKYRYYNGPDFHFLKNTTNDAIKPYKFMDDQTWVGIPVFLAGLIAKSEKYAFRQDYNNPNTRIRLIKYNFHSEIDNYTQFSGIALTAGLKMAGVEGRSSWPRLFASSLASYAVMAGFVNGIKYAPTARRTTRGPRATRQPPLSAQRSCTRNMD